LIRALVPIEKCNDAIIEERELRERQTERKIVERERERG
jgi:hypothetical protein